MRRISGRVEIGEWVLMECEHGGLWFANKDGEGMQITGETIDELKALLADFFKRHM